MDILIFDLGLYLQYSQMADRSKDWLNQALKDLNHAKISLEHKDCEWACFASHQAAEEVVKELLLNILENYRQRRLNQVVWIED